MWDSGSSQNITDSSPLKMVQQRAPCQAISTSPQSRVGPKLAQPPGMGQHPKSGRSFITEEALLSFPLTSCQYYIAAQPSYNTVVAVSIQPLNSGISYLWGISIVCLDFVQQQVEWSAQHQVLVNTPYFLHQKHELRFSCVKYGILRIAFPLHLHQQLLFVEFLTMAIKPFVR